MSGLERQAIHRKITGLLLRHARVRSGRNQADLADALHVSRRRYTQYELGQSDITLPELEQIASLCGVPLSFFFDEQSAVQDEGAELACQTAPRLQRKIVGAQLRQARQRAGKSIKECAEVLGVTTRLLCQYEKGEKDIPPQELEALASYLGVSVGSWAVVTN